jgi:hypothetical protein
LTSGFSHFEIAPFLFVLLSFDFLTLMGQKKNHHAIIPPVAYRCRRWRCICLGHPENP